MHPSTTAGASQCETILALLVAAAGRWVSMMDLHRASGSMAVHSRIADLRKRGHDIRQKNDRLGKSVRSSYKLILPAATEQPELNL